MKKCPFCGSENVEAERYSEIMWTVNCYTCNCEGPDAESKQLAEDVWNNRFIDQDNTSKLLGE